MAEIAPAPLYDELVELLVETANRERLSAFHLSDERQERLDSLLERNRQGTLTPAESAELDDFERFEHVVRLLKARLRSGTQ